jgi:hypothetical protein
MRANEQRQCQCKRQQRVAPQPRSAVDRGRRGFAGTGRAVTGALHRDNKIARRGGPGYHFDAGGFGCEIDGNPRDAGHRTQRCFQPRHTTGTGHAIDIEPNRLHRDGIAGRVDRTRQGQRVEPSSLDGSRLGSEVDSDVPYAVNARDCLLDMGDAAGAGHPLDRQYKSLRRRGGRAALHFRCYARLVHRSRLYARGPPAISGVAGGLRRIKKTGCLIALNVDMWAPSVAAMAGAAIAKLHGSPP